METKTPKHRLPLLIYRQDIIKQKLGFELNSIRNSAVVGKEGYETRAATCHQLWIRFIEDALKKKVRERADLKFDAIQDVAIFLPKG